MKIKPIYRSNKNKLIAGVAGGLAGRFKLDAKILRILIVIGSLFPPSSLFTIGVYTILWLIMPIKKTRESSNQAQDIFKQFFNRETPGRVVDASDVQKKS